MDINSNNSNNRVTVILDHLTGETHIFQSDQEKECEKIYNRSRFWNEKIECADLISAQTIISAFKKTFHLSPDIRLVARSTIDYAVMENKSGRLYMSFTTKVMLSNN